MKICIIIPVFNSEGLIENVIKDCLKYDYDIFVVNDGSTDNTLNVINKFKDSVKIISYLKNKGKGYALKTGFQHALKSGYDYAITLDADGQHRPEDILLFIDEIQNNKNIFIIGCRNFSNPNMPKQNRFANKFSNFWFLLQTAHKLPDTQTGFRLYPLKKFKSFKPLTNRYEAELEMLVRSAWSNIKIIPIFINVFYPKKEERISHFKPQKDFLKISLLNTVLCLIAVVYGYPSMIFLKTKKIFSNK